MDNHESIENAVTEDWLRQGKELVLCAMKRLKIQRDLCPLMSDESERKKLLPKLAELNAEIDRRCESMRKLETAHFGCGAILGADCHKNALYVACLLLVFSRMNDAVDCECHLVSHIVQLVGPDPCDALIVRDAFRTTGMLFPHVSLTEASALDRSHAEISEVAFNSVLGRRSTEHEVFLHLKNIMETVEARSKKR